MYGDKPGSADLVAKFRESLPAKKVRDPVGYCYARQDRDLTCRDAIKNRTSTSS